MSKKTKKAQVVIAAIDETSQSFHILLLQTNKARGEFWQNITGKIEDEETVEEGGLREAIEETGLSIEDIVDMVDLGLIYEFTDQHGRKVTERSFLFVLDKKWTVKIDPKEHQNFKWVPLVEIGEGSVKFSSNYESLQKALLTLRHWGM